MPRHRYFSEISGTDIDNQVKSEKIEYLIIYTLNHDPHLLDLLFETTTLKLETKMVFFKKIFDDTSDLKIIIYKIV